MTPILAFVALGVWRKITGQRSYFVAAFVQRGGE